jgi:hypothetical protein
LYKNLNISDIEENIYLNVVLKSDFIPVTRLNGYEKHLERLFFLNVCFMCAMSL